MQNIIEHIKRNRECCGAGYATGKDYGYYWIDHGVAEKTKGLCELGYKK